jgi:hypothetical protein
MLQALRHEFVLFSDDPGTGQPVVSSGFHVGGQAGIQPGIAQGVVMISRCILRAEVARRLGVFPLRDASKTLSNQPIQPIKPEPHV